MSDEIVIGSAWGGVAPAAHAQPRARPTDARSPLDRRALEEAMILGGQRGSEDQRAVRVGELNTIVDGLAGELTQQFQVPIKELSGLIADPALLFRNAGLSAPEIVDALPFNDNFPGQLVFLTTDNKLYRWTGTEWTAAVPAVDIAGQISAEQIAAEVTSAISAAQAEATLADQKATAIRADHDALVSGFTGTISAAFTNVSTTISDLEGAIAVDISNLTNAVDAVVATVADETTARITADTAEINARQSLATQLRGTYSGTNIAEIQGGLIYSERQARITADSNLQTQINTLVAASSGDFGDLFAAIEEESTARINADAALSGNFSDLTARLDNVLDANGNPTNKTVEATISDDRIARVSGDDALSAQITSLAATVTSNNNTLTSAVTAATTASADADAALAADILSLEATVNQNNSTLSAAIENATAVSADADAVLASDITSLTATLANFSAQSVFSENWMADAAINSWERHTGSGELSIIEVSDAPVGAKVLNVGNNSGNDEYWASSRRLIPFDSTRLYKMTVVARQLLGSGKVYFGYTGVASDGVTLCSAAGLNTFSSQHYHVASGSDLGTEWTAFVGYSRGFGTPNGNVGASTAESPKNMHANVRFLRPMFIVGYNDQPGQVQIASIVVEDVTDVQNVSAGLQAESVVRASEDAALASDILGLEATIGGLSATLTNDYFTAVETDTAIAASASALQANIDGISSTVTTQGSAIADLEGNASAGYLIKAQAGSQVSLLDLIAADGVSGPVSVAKISATNIILDGTVTAASLATDSVIADKIKADAVTAVKIKAGAVTAEKIEAGAVSADKIAANTIEGGNIKANTITGGLLATSGIITQAAQIGNGIITNAQISNLAANRITADKIDTRGLSIQDANGNIILAAGTPLTTANISGLGTLATANSVSYSSVTGTKPPTNADRTASNIAAGIANQGNFATLDQITSSNVSTYIASAAIRNAQIGNAQVNTLQVAGEAITAPSISYIDWGGTVFGGASQQLAVAAGINSVGIATYINFTCSLDTPNTPAVANFYLYRQGTLISYFAQQLGARNSPGYVFVDYPPAGYVVYQVNILVTAAGRQARLYQTGLYAIQFKR